jgi:hypothetical protein
MTSSQAQSCPAGCDLDCDRLQAEISFAGRAAPICALSVAGIVNAEEPQSKQIRIFKKTRTPGLSMFLKAGVMDIHFRSEFRLTAGGA